MASDLAVRERAALFDETSFAKFEVSGPGALGLLQRLCANDVDVRIGRIVPQMLNGRAGSNRISRSPGSATNSSVS